MAQEHPINPGRANPNPSHGRVGYLLIVEPEALLRWSLATYLSKWFDVFPTDSPKAAGRILDDHAIDALVVSDQLPAESVGELEQHVRSQNASARLVRTVTGLESEDGTTSGWLCIEKPFELAKLAGLLGVDAGRSPS